MYKLCQAFYLVILLCFFLPTFLSGQDLQDVRTRNVLRHIGVPYANFVTGDGRGLSVELIERFAHYLGVRYEFVQSSWTSVISDLIGNKVLPEGDKAVILESTPVRGDLIANGLTILPWRQQVLAYSAPTFPTQVWLITGSSSTLAPVSPGKNTKEDIRAVKNLLAGRTLLGKYNTCLDPRLYGLDEGDVLIRNFTGNLNSLTPAIIRGEADAALLDVPDALMALSRWPGQFKILGPISDQQQMGVAFRKDSPELLAAFNTFFNRFWKTGKYRELVRKYYPDVFDYYPDFFSRTAPESNP